MQTITATVPVTLPPSWATQQRLLLSTMSDSVYPFLDRYTHDDGELIYDVGAAAPTTSTRAIPTGPCSTWWEVAIIWWICRTGAGKR